jgi:ring-1,2-phenylacetyl-CoA epoxidase subunit PaaB
MKDGWKLWEVFVRANRGLNHVHVGSLHAADAATATQNAESLYTRRGEGVSVWVVPSEIIVASTPYEDNAVDTGGKAYRHPTFYEIPEEVGHM